MNKSNNIIEKIISIAMKNYQNNSMELRYGQALFNALNEVFPDIANEIRGTEIDCFYDDKNINKFLDFLYMKIEGNI